MLYADHGRMLLSHLVASSPEELEQAGIALGLPESARHNGGSPGEHLDVSESKRTATIRNPGAKPVSSRDLVEIIRGKRKERQQPQGESNHAG